MMSPETKHRWRIRWFLIQAHAYALFHPGCRVVTETRWVEGPPEAIPSIFCTPVDDRPVTEEYTFIGVFRGRWFDETIEVVRWYYGNPKFVGVRGYDGRHKS